MILGSRIIFSTKLFLFFDFYFLLFTEGTPNKFERVDANSSEFRVRSWAIHYFVWIHKQNIVVYV